MSSLPDADVDAPTARLSTGRVRGTSRCDGTAVYLGIPYAQPPVGDLRFAAPVPPQPWDDVLEAREYGPTPQRGDLGDTLIPEPSIPGENTLTVNVFAPVDDAAAGSPAARHPVLVYIHGGGFVQGSPASPWYDGSGFARAGIVVVTLGYRLGFDGFGSIPGAPSNRGVRDWLAALEWVRREIAAFGGDPGDVTIAGQSAGGAAVLTLLGMPSAQHLFHKVLSLSPALTDVPADRAAALTERLAARLGVAPTRAGFAAVDELRVLQAQRDLGDERQGGPLALARDRLATGLLWGPEVDGDLIPRPTADAVAAGIGADKPLVLGTTDDEFTMIADGLTDRVRAVPPAVALLLLGVGHATRWRYIRANRAQRRRGTAAFLGRYVTDRVFRETVPRIADARSGGGDAGAARPRAATWAYRFTWPSPTMRWALHCLDVPFWWDRLDAPGVSKLAGDAPPQALADAMHGAARALVRTGSPGWVAWSEQPGATRVFGGASSDPSVIADGYASVRPLLGP